MFYQLYIPVEELYPQSISYTGLIEKAKSVNLRSQVEVAEFSIQATVFALSNADPSHMPVPESTDTQVFSKRPRPLEHDKH